MDYEHYKALSEDAKVAYDQACQEYSAYVDAHQNPFLQNIKTRQAVLENAMQLKYTIHSAMMTNEQNAMAELQARTPVFTTLTNATVPVKPAGPKRMIFVAVMLFLATIGTVMYLYRKELKDWF